MNIFVLHKDPNIAAQMLCDKHIVKMPLETAQLLCSVFLVALNNSDSIVRTKSYTITVPYKLTHCNHPCSIWARISQGNFDWLIKHGQALCKEYTYRYKKEHKSENVINWCYNNKDILLFQTDCIQNFAQALPEQYKCSDAIKAYREYYLHEKLRFARWENGRKAPNWVKI
ncbi:pyrimidine dimer DNA glycosylase/endonuclease V [Orientia tsutsugamushi]|uniref:Uncharacterized protein n=1 Tax=Orientia tsutsugamushi (strain Boryong) TaxID=357244 RepID=A5CF16_ORITB|nr:pyrimidine dimer DNA glycosylase/endonuclease V [Orientia tsutsugamushi]CAM80866.1 conserved hypothetical protein [Orientia tsutsugamushi str. Boryong]